MGACRGLFVCHANRRDAPPRGLSGFGRDSLQTRKIRFASGFERFPTDIHPSIALGISEMRQLKARTLNCSDHRSGRSIRLSNVSVLSSAGCCPRTIVSTIVGATKARRERRST